MTEGFPGKVLLLFTLPIIAGDFFRLFYSMADAIIVGQTLGTGSLAAIGCTTPLLSFVFGFTIGLTAGFSIILAQRFGAGDAGALRLSFTAGLILCAAAALLILALFLPLVRPVLDLLNTPAEIKDEAASYMYILIGGVGVALVDFLLSNCVRSLGDSRTPLYFQAAASLVNIVLDYVFILIFHWGVAGAAIATVIANFCTAVLCAVHIVRRYPDLLPSRDLFRGFSAKFFPEAKVLLPLGLSMGVQRSIVEIGNILVQGAMNGLGALSIAAVAAGQRIRQLNMLPLFAVSMSVSVFTAQNYGAGKIKRIYSGIRQASFISVGFCALMALVNFSSGTLLPSLFLKDSPEAAALAVRYIRYIGAALSFLALMLIFRSSMQGMGKNISPTVCSVLETAMSVVTAFLLVPRFGFTGICMANPLSWIVSGIPLYIAFAMFIRDSRRPLVPPPVFSGGS
ncbi:MAG: MATE family efflux transporter [Treponema sp.]|jgi:putative MATE family efflux protein|nr:MATE family efflux transporter [Treponema sp.]